MCVYIYIFTVVSINGGTPKSSILDWDFPLYTSHSRGAPDRNIGSILRSGMPSRSWLRSWGMPLPMGSGDQLQISRDAKRPVASSGFGIFHGRSWGRILGTDFGMTMCLVFCWKQFQQWGVSAIGDTEYQDVPRGEESNQPRLCDTLNPAA